jgi:hypothetical protein
MVERKCSMINGRGAGKISLDAATERRDTWRKAGGMQVCGERTGLAKTGVFPAELAISCCSSAFRQHIQNHTEIAHGIKTYIKFKRPLTVTV